MTFKVVVQLEDIDFEETFDSEREALVRAHAWKAENVGTVLITHEGKGAAHRPLLFDHLRNSNK